MTKIKIPIITFEEIDFNFNMLLKYLLDNNAIYEDDGTRAFTSTKQLIYYLKEDFEMNWSEYLTNVFKVGLYSWDFIDDFEIIREYSKFINEKFKGVHIKDVYDANPYKKI